LADAGVTSYRAVSRALPWLRPGVTALVIGAGGLGQFAIQYLRLLTAATVVAVDPSEAKRRRALSLGARDVVAPAFFRREPRLRARSYLLGLASGLERKNGWTLAEFAGEATPDGMQRLLSAAVRTLMRSAMRSAGTWPRSWAIRAGR
jgi:threonine dehydrogenase-like Zn-dependent dehydrogenase